MVYSAIANVRPADLDKAILQCGTLQGAHEFLARLHGEVPPGIVRAAERERRRRAEWKRRFETYAQRRARADAAKRRRTASAPKAPR